MERDYIVTSPYTLLGRTVLEMPIGVSLNLFDEDEVYMCTIIKVDKEKVEDA